MRGSFAILLEIAEFCQVEESIQAKKFIDIVNELNFKQTKIFQGVNLRQFIPALEKSEKEGLLTFATIADALINVVHMQ